MNLLPKEILAALPSILGSAAVAPSLLVLWTIASMDNRREPIRVVFGAFLFGAAGALLVSFLNIPFPGLSYFAATPVAQTYLHATFEVAAPEETIKLIVLVLFCSRYIAYDHPMEGVVYGAAVGLGFAAYENLFYLTNNTEHWLPIALMRGLFTVPVHGALAIIIGIYVAKARAAQARHRSFGLRFRDYFTGWAVAVVLHGMFDFPLLLQQQLKLGQNDYVALLASVGIAVAGVTSIIAAIVIYRARRAQAGSANSFTTGHKFRNHPWHRTSLVAIILFLILLPIAGWIQLLLKRTT